MSQKITLIILLLISFKAFSQNLTEKDFVILTFEMDRNKDSHGTFVYYWVAEMEKYINSDEYKNPIIYSIFLHEFYSSDQLEECCLGNMSHPFTYTTASKFDFPDNYSQYLTNLRKLVKLGRKKIQVIKKEWKNNYKEKVTIYATSIRGKLCECEMEKNRFLTKGDRISFPKGTFEIIENYLTDEKRILLFKDFSNFDFTNTDYLTGK